MQKRHKVELILILIVNIILTLLLPTVIIWGLFWGKGILWGHFLFSFVLLLFLIPSWFIFNSIIKQEKEKLLSSNEEIPSLLKLLKYGNMSLVFITVIIIAVLITWIKIQ